MQLTFKHLFTVYWTEGCWACLSSVLLNFRSLSKLINISYLFKLKLKNIKIISHYVPHLLQLITYVLQATRLWSSWSCPCLPHQGILGMLIQPVAYWFVTSALDGNEWSTGRPGLLLGKTPSSTWIVGCGWEGVRAGLDDLENGKISWLWRDLISELSFP